MQRTSSQLTGSDIAIMLVRVAVKNQSVTLQEMVEMLRERRPQIQITTQGLQQRINTKSAEVFIKRIFEETFKEFIFKVKNQQRDLGKFLNPFTRVLLEDSTFFELREKLKDFFPGMGGNASKASGKIDFVYDFKDAGITFLKEYPGKTMEELKKVKKKPLVRHLNRHTDGYKFFWYWDKSISNIPNNTVYRFFPSRTNSRTIAEALKEGHNINYYL